MTKRRIPPEELDDAPDVRNDPVDGPVQHLPEVSSEDPVHVLDASCWCDPVVTTVPPAIHHRDQGGSPVDHSKEEPS